LGSDEMYGSQTDAEQRLCSIKKMHRASKPQRLSLQPEQINVFSCACSYLK